MPSLASASPLQVEGNHCAMPLGEDTVLHDEPGDLLSRGKKLKQVLTSIPFASNPPAAHILATWGLSLLYIRPPLATYGRSPPFMQECLMLATHLSGP